MNGYVCVEGGGSREREERRTDRQKERGRERGVRRPSRPCNSR